MPHCRRLRCTFRTKSTLSRHFINHLDAATFLSSTVHVSDGIDLIFPPIGRHFGVVVI